MVKIKNVFSKNHQNELQQKRQEEYAKKQNLAKETIAKEFEQKRDAIINSKNNYAIKNREQVASLIQDNNLDYLDKKVEKFITWYFENFVKGNYTDIGEFFEPRDLKNFIDKMAVWYEMRYPEYEINRILPGSGQQNSYVDDLLLNKGVDSIGWRDLFDMESFIQTLSCEELYYLRTPKFPSIYSLYSNISGHFHITSEGKIEEAEDVIYEESEFSYIKRGQIISKYFDGLNLGQAKELLELYGLKKDAGEIQKMIDSYNLRLEFKERLLNAVMYKIIERGGNRIGPRRAFLFAKEFNLNIEIPMAYGVDYSDPGLRNFINEYIKAGGDSNLECISNYFCRKNDNSKISDVVTISELLKNIHANCVEKYTPEEKNLQKRLIRVLQKRTKIDRKKY